MNLLEMYNEFKEKKAEYFYFYVEKYDKENRELLLDFVKLIDYISVVKYSRLEINGLESLSMNHIKPSRIYLYNCAPKSLRRENVILKIRSSAFLEMIDYSHVVREGDTSSYSLVFLRINDQNSWFESIINESEQISEDRLSSFEPDEWRSMFPNIIDNGNGGEIKDEGIIAFFDELDGEIAQVVAFDVGQGNANGLFTKDKALLYDLGAHNSANNVKVKRTFYSEYNLYKGKEYGLIISHWDIDHYQQLCVAPNIFFHRMSFIIFPAVVNTVAAAQLILQFSSATYCNRCFAVLPAKAIRGNDSFKHIMSCFTDSTCFDLYCGQNKYGKNNSGLVFCVDGFERLALFTGDRERWNKANFTETAQDKELVIIVPHHGAKKPDIPPVNHPWKALVSVGNNIWSHPDATKIKQYQTLGYDVKRTDNIGDIWVYFGVL